MVLFSRIICHQPLSSICIVIVFKKIKDLIFMDDKLPAKTVKITSLENLYIYGRTSQKNPLFSMWSRCCSLCSEGYTVYALVVHNV